MLLVVGVVCCFDVCRSSLVSLGGSLCVVRVFGVCVCSLSVVSCVLFGVVRWLWFVVCCQSFLVGVVVCCC